MLARGYSTVDGLKKFKSAMKDNPAKLQGRNEFCLQRIWQPLAGCFPVLVNASTFALFATLRGSPFSDVNYTVNLQIFPKNKSNKFNPSLCHFPRISISPMGFMFPLPPLFLAATTLTVAKQN